MSIFDDDEAQIMLIEYVVNDLDMILELKDEIGKKVSGGLCRHRTDRST